MPEALAARRRSRLLECQLAVRQALAGQDPGSKVDGVLQEAIRARDSERASLLHYLQCEVVAAYRKAGDPASWSLIGEQLAAVRMCTKGLTEALHKDAFAADKKDNKAGLGHPSGAGSVDDIDHSSITPEASTSCVDDRSTALCQAVSPDTLVRSWRDASPEPLADLVSGEATATEAESCWWWTVPPPREMPAAPAGEVADRARGALAEFEEWKASGVPARERTEAAARGMEAVLSGLGVLFQGKERAPMSFGEAARSAEAAEALRNAVVMEHRVLTTGAPLKALRGAGVAMLAALCAKEEALQQMEWEIGRVQRECEDASAALKIQQDGTLHAQEEELLDAKESLHDLKHEYEKCRLERDYLQGRGRAPAEKLERLQEEMRRAQSAMQAGKCRVRAALSAVLLHQAAFPEILRHLHAGVPSDLAALWDPVCTLADFEVSPLRTSEIGRHEVYKATRDGVTYALKVYKIPLAEPEQLRVLWHEASLLRRLEHPAIVPVLGVFFAQPAEHGLHHIALKLPFYECGHLATWVRSDDPPDARALRLALLRVLEAVAHLHSNHVVHCDIKPENILVDGLGRTYLTDFDISLDGAERATKAISQ
eukprot:gene24061-29201_t